MTQTPVPSEENSKLPVQVRQAAERAQKFLRDHMDPHATEQPAAPPGVAVNVEGQPIASAPTQATAVPATTSTPVPSPTEDPRHSDINYWKHRVSILDGMLRKAKTNKDVEVTELRQKLAAAQDELHQAKRAAPLPDVDPTQYYSAEEIAELGEDQAKIHAKALARQRHNDTLRQEEERVKQARAEAERDSQRSQKEQADAHNQMITDLEREIPDWAAINTSAGWLDWLSETDDNTGLQRQELIEVAESKKDGRALAKLMKRYIATLNIAPVPASPPVQPAATGANGHAQPNSVTAIKGYPSSAEQREFFKRLKLTDGRGFKPSGFRAVTDEERTEFFARLNAAQGARTV